MKTNLAKFILSHESEYFKEQLKLNNAIKDITATVDFDDEMENPLNFYDTPFNFISFDKDLSLSNHHFKNTEALAMSLSKHYNVVPKDEEDETYSIIHQLIDDERLILVPLIVYEHSGYAISYRNDIYPFNDRWDSGQRGWILCSRQDVMNTLGIDNTNWKEKAFKELDSYIELINDYLSGQVFCFGVKAEIECPHCHNIDIDWLEGCGGFYGASDEEMLEEICHFTNTAKDSWAQIQ